MKFKIFTILILISTSRILFSLMVRGGEDLTTMSFYNSAREISMGNISVDSEDASNVKSNPAAVGSLKGSHAYGFLIPLYLKNTYYFSSAFTMYNRFVPFGVSYGPKCLSPVRGSFSL